MPYIKGLTRYQDLLKLESEIKSCKGCNLCQTGNRPVSRGSLDSEIMIVGDFARPEAIEGRQPFDGPAADLLFRMFASAESKISPRWNTSNFYLTNLVKGAPTKDGKPRPPTLDEAAACYLHVKQEIELVKPRLIICLGEEAARFLIGPDFEMNTDQGKLYGNEPKIIAMVHPAEIVELDENSKEGKQTKMLCWKTILQAEQFLNTPKPE